MPLASSSKTASSLPVHQPINNELKQKPTVALINNDKSAPLESNLKSNHDDLKTFNYNNDWRKVNNKRRYVRAPPVGKLNSSNLKAVIRPAVLFATRFSPETTANDITKFTGQQFPALTDIKCTKLPTKFDTYSSFKLEIIGVDIKDALNLELWPVGILVKKFYSPRSEGRANMARSNSSQEEASSFD